MTIDKEKKYFLISLGCLLFFGILLVYSSSYIFSKEVFGFSHFLILKHLIFLVLGGAGAFVLSKTKSQFWLSNSYKLNFLISILLVLTFIPGLGISIKGSQRWLNLGLFTIQPGELVKYTIMISAYRFFETFEDLDVNSRYQNAGNILFPLILLVLQPDFGTFAICTLMILYVCYLSRLNRQYLFSMVTIGVVGFLSILFAAPYRVKRILTFMDPWSDPKNSGFQIIQSYLAFANGHIFGQGVGNSTEKLFYLPEAHNDFIFSVAGEELGFIGLVVIVFVFWNLLYWGFKIAKKINNNNNSNIINAVVFLISVQAIMNMGVVLGLLPTKGLNLPFISYGGSSLMANLFGIGLVLSCMSKKSENCKLDTNGQFDGTDLNQNISSNFNY